MNKNNCYHKIRAPAVQGSNEPAERNLMIENLQAVPGLARCGYVHGGKKNPGDNLENGHCQCRTAKNVEPACGLPRDRMLLRLSDWAAEVNAEADAVGDVANEAHPRPPGWMLGPGEGVV